MNGETTTKQASWWVLIVVAFLIGGFLGYYLGTKQVGSGLITDENQDTLLDNQAADEGVENTEALPGP